MIFRYKQAAFCYEELILSQPTVPLYHLAYADVCDLSMLHIFIVVYVKFISVYAYTSMHLGFGIFFNLFAHSKALQCGMNPSTMSIPYLLTGGIS